MRVATTKGWREVVWEVLDGAGQTVAVFSTPELAHAWVAERDKDSLYVSGDASVVDYPDEEFSVLH